MEISQEAQDYTDIYADYLIELQPMIKSGNLEGMINLKRKYKSFNSNMTRTSLQQDIDALEKVNDEA